MDFKSSVLYSGSLRHKDYEGYKLDIADVSKACGLPASTLRYYEEKGLIQSVGRNGLRRVFNYDVLEKLALISMGRNAGLSLSEIASMFTSDGTKIDRALLLEKAEALEVKIKEMTTMAKGLRHAATCKESDQLECPKFRRLMRMAGKNPMRPNNKLK